MATDSKLLSYIMVFTVSGYLPDKKYISSLWINSSFSYYVFDEDDRRPNQVTLIFIDFYSGFVASFLRSTWLAALLDSIRRQNAINCMSP